MQNAADTIFAIATPPGRSGVAVIRLSGPDALACLPSLGFIRPPRPRYAHLHNFTRPSLSGPEPLDTGLLLYFPAPASFTGEDTLEFQLHGSPAVLRAMLAHLATLPHFRPAEAGEFTRRAFANGKLDLAEAEGLGDLLEAETESQRQQAQFWMNGEASVYYTALRARILEPLALLEAFIDFPDEDIPPDLEAEITGIIEDIKAQCRHLLQHDTQGERVREGFRIVLAGEPNAGKSTLLNRLAQRDVAIISPSPGTTRDVLEVALDLGGVAVTLCDTAGLRETADDVEREGVRRSQREIARADRTLYLTAPEGAEPDRAALPYDTLYLATKADLFATPPSHGCPFSSSRDEDVQWLIAELRQWASNQIPASPSLLIRQRHRSAIAQALQELEDYAMQPLLELRCERLRLAAQEIGRITGAIDVEELLDHIFFRFCIGK